MAAEAAERVADSRAAAAAVTETREWVAKVAAGVEAAAVALVVEAPVRPVVANRAAVEGGSEVEREVAVA